VSIVVAYSQFWSPPSSISCSYRWRERERKNPIFLAVGSLFMISLSPYDCRLRSDLGGMSCSFSLLSDFFLYSYPCPLMRRNEKQYDNSAGALIPCSFRSFRSCQEPASPVPLLGDRGGLVWQTTQRGDETAYERKSNVYTLIACMHVTYKNRRRDKSGHFCLAGFVMEGVECIYPYRRRRSLTRVFRNKRERERTLDHLTR